MKFKISLFDHKADNVPRQVERTWPKIRSKVLRPPLRAEKDGALYAPAIFDPPLRRLKNVVEVSLLVLDYDHDADFERDLQPWRDRGCAFAAHTTFSHSEDSHRFRVIIPLTKPIPAADFPRLWKWASQISGGKVDAAASDSSRMFYVPGRRSETAPYLSDIQDGDFLDWQSLDLPQIDPAPARIASETASSKPIDSLLRKAFAAKNGDSVFRLFQGDTADYGGDDSRADQALCSKLAFWSGGDPQTLDQMFRSSRLFRDKWDERHGGDGRTYGEMTIDKALQGRSEFYTNGNGRAVLSQRKPATIVSAPDLLAKKFVEVAWVVLGLLLEGSLTIIASKPKIGKTFFALGLAIAIAADGMALGSIKVEQGAVLYLALEDGERRMQSRLQRMLGYGEVPASLFFAWEWLRLNEGGLEALQDFITAHPKLKLIVVDTLKRIRPREDGRGRLYDLDYDSLAGLADLAHSNNVSILIVHHSRKMASDDPLDLISGSLGLSGAADAALIMQRTRGEAGAILICTGRDFEDKGLALTFDKELFGWKLLGDAAELKRSNERQEVLALLKKSGPLGPKAVSDLLGKQYSSTKKLLWTMSKDGELCADKKGVYSLPGNHGNPVTEKPGRAPAKDANLHVYNSRATGDGLLRPGASQAEVEAHLAAWLAREDAAEAEAIRAEGCGER